MKEKVIKDPLCGMSVNEIFSPHAERDGKTFYFCGESCKKNFETATALKLQQKNK